MTSDTRDLAARLFLAFRLLSKSTEEEEEIHYVHTASKAQKVCHARGSQNWLIG